MATVPATPQDEILTVAEIERRYPDEWVLVEITHDHKRHERIKGRLLAHSANRHALDEPYRRLRAERPEAHTYEFFTGNIIPKDRDFVVILCGRSQRCRRERVALTRQLDANLGPVIVLPIRDAS